VRGTKRGEQERTKRGDEAEVKGMFMPGEDGFGEGG